MKKTGLFFVLLFALTTVNAQDYQLSTGYNYTQYKFNNSQQETQEYDRGEGTFYQLAYENNLANKDYLFYQVALSTNSFNGLGSLQGNALSWNTRYVGLSGGVVFKIPVKTVTFRLQANAGAHCMVYGKQYIGGALFDLKDAEEFDGMQLMVGGSIGLEKQLTPNIAIHTGYGLSTSALSTNNNSTANLQLTTRQLSFGILIKSTH